VDSLTHILLGGAIAQLVAARRVGMGRAFWLGALAATIPDFDSFAHTGDVMRDFAMHRHFMHSLVMVPVIATVAMLPFLVQKKARAMWRPLYLAALIACVSHTLLDLLTSYGNMILWPFTERRYALDIIAVVDPAVTLPLLVGTLLAWRLKRIRWSAIALAVALAYFGLATWQHARAGAAQRELLATRQITNPIKPRVLPQIGGTLNYRSIYIANDQIHADAIRVPYFGKPLFKLGGSLPVLKFSHLQSPLPPDADQHFSTFHELADGFIARSPTNPLLLADERYAFLPEGRESVWGIQLEQTDHTVFRLTPRSGYMGKLARDLFKPQGYSPLEAAAIVR
jgi:inner membrane protein